MGGGTNQLRQPVRRPEGKSRSKPMGGSTHRVRTHGLELV